MESLVIEVHLHEHISRKESPGMLATALRINHRLRRDKHATKTVDEVVTLHSLLQRADSFVLRAR
jgi:hypothetical protein